VQTSAASTVTANSTVLNGDNTSDNGYGITDYGFLWGTSASSLINKLDEGTDNRSGAFTATLSSLTAGTTYYCEAYATNSQGTADGAVMSFTTETQAPTIIPSALIAPAPTVHAFSDVSTSYWGHDAISNLSGKGFVYGYSDGTFKPGNQITRAEFCAIMDKVLNLTTYPQQTQAFTDVNTADWYNQAVETAVYAGIVKGYGDGTFHPNAPISRQEIACVLVQALGKSQLAEENDNNATKFLDDHSIALWSRGFVAVALQQGIVNGYPSGSFKPKNETTRAEACAMIMNFLKSYK
jgi:2',3'-cyclic-nucleotide 2'-phosphodiesterase/3'-nucleotidase/5'-nucleotidase